MCRHDSDDTKGKQYGGKYFGGDDTNDKECDVEESAATIQTTKSVMGNILGVTIQTTKNVMGNILG